MDPDATLSILRDALRRLERDRGDLPPSSITDAIADAYETFTVLDEWLSKGGFSPAEWSKR
jgi:hypothetical protein